MNKIEQMFYLRRKHDGLYFCGYVVLPSNDLGSIIWATTPIRISASHVACELALLDPESYELITIDHIYSIQRIHDSAFYCGKDGLTGIELWISDVQDIEYICFLPFYHSSIYLASIRPDIYRIATKNEIRLTKSQGGAI